MTDNTIHDDDDRLAANDPMLLRLAAVFGPVAAYVATTEDAPSRCPWRACRAAGVCHPSVAGEGELPRCRVALRKEAYDLAADIVQHFGPFLRGGDEPGDIGFLPVIRGDWPIDEALRKPG